jgi:hypothetical protein
LGLRLAFAAALAVLAGASSWLRPGAAGEPMPADPDAITIIVQNNVMPPIPITVYIIEETGTSTRLGQVSGASTERFTPRIPPTGRAQLYARSSDGGERVSNSVSLRPSQTLEWDLFTNVVTERFGGAAREPRNHSRSSRNPLASREHHGRTTWPQRAVTATDTGSLQTRRVERACAQDVHASR